MNGAGQDLFRIIFLFFYMSIANCDGFKYDKPFIDSVNDSTPVYVVAICYYTS